MSPIKENKYVIKSKTEENLKVAFAGEVKLIEDICILLKADVEGYNDVAAVFRSTAEGETGMLMGT